MSTAIAALVVGGAVLAPSLLSDATDILNADGSPPTGVVVPATVTEGQRAAVALLKGNIAGTSDTGVMSDANPQVSNRFIDCMRQLIALRGAFPQHVGLAKVTIDDALQVHTAFLEACRAAVAADPAHFDLGFTRVAADGLFDVMSEIFSTVVDTATGGEPVSQTDLMGRLLANDQSIDESKLSGLGTTVLACVREKIAANLAQAGTSSDDTIFTAVRGEASMLAAAELCTKMDAAGLAFNGQFDPPSEVSFGEFGKRLGDVVSTVSSAAAGVIGEAAASVLFSTPVLLLLGGFLVYRAVAK